MKALKNITLALAAAVALATGISQPAAAQAGAIGFVDMERVFESANAKATGEQELQTRGRAVESRITKLGEATLLPPAEWKEYRTLLEKASPTSADTTRINALQQKVTQLDAELKNLQQSQNPTDVQKSRLNEMSGYRATNLGELNQSANNWWNGLGEFQVNLRNQIVASITQAAAKVVADKNLSILLNKSVILADHDPQLLVVAGGVDVTEDIIKAVNAN